MRSVASLALLLRACASDISWTAERTTVGGTDVEAIGAADSRLVAVVELP